MEPGVFLAALLIFVGIPAFTVLRIARLRASRPQSLPADVTERLQAVEHRVEDLQQELAETQERLDFAERLLTKAREERRLEATSTECAAQQAHGIAGGVVFLLVDDVDALHRELLQRKVGIDLEPTDQSWGNREMYVTDPDGNSIRFVREEGS
jgi:catechol 2,3-dioxygenase-like lactoylglutathione lyase family enzyme